MSTEDVESNLIKPQTTINHVPAKTNAGPMPENTANFFSQITYSWMDKLFWKGYKAPLTEEDMYTVSDYHDPTVQQARFEVLWAQELENAKIRKEKHAKEKKDDSEALLVDSKKKKKKEKYLGPDLFAVLFKQYGWKLGPIGIPKVISDFAQVFSPFILKELVLFIGQSQKGDLPIGKGIGLAIGLFLLQVTSTLLVTWYFHAGQSGAIAIRSLLTGAIYRKSLRLSGAARQDFNSGKIMNIVSTDATRIEQFLGIIHLVWTAPIQLVVIIAFLVLQLGWAAVIGVGLLILLSPLQGVLFQRLMAIRKIIAPITDKRVKQTNEMLQGIRIIKYFTWENSFLKRIEDTRKSEIKQLLRRGYISAFVQAFFFAMPILCSAIAFMAYIFLTPNPDPAAIFASLAWFNLLRLPLMLLPQVIAGWADFSVALNRIAGLLTAPEIEDPPKVDKDAEFAVNIDNGTFKWEEVAQVSEFLTKTDKKMQKQMQKKEGKANGKELEVPKTDKIEPASEAESDENLPTLRNINLKIARGQLVAVVGAVGSGKSSLLNALIGEMKRLEGDVTLGGTVSYAAQQAWIQNASLEKNITFGLPYDEARYQLAVKNCCLESDFKVLPDGDQTEIGERGINISGGQKQRVNLARTVYFNSDIVLLDDPLSAVDAHVGKRLFHDCIRGVLAGKTRVLVTHQLHYLPEVDYIVVMKNGEISEQGKYQDLMSNDGAFSKLMYEYGGVERSESEDEDGNGFQTANDAKKEMAVEDPTEKDEKAGVKKPAAELMQAEERAVGAVAGRVWWSYGLAAGGYWFFANLFILIVFLQGGRIVSDFWLAEWTNPTIAGFSQGAYAGIYMGLGLSQVLFTFFVGVFLIICGTRASRILHENALSNIIRAPVTFFDTTPLGRIINRFSKDQDAIDSTLMDTFRIFLFTFALTIATFVTIVYVTPWFAVPLAPMLVAYYYLQLIYRSIARELKRIDSLTRSPLYAFFGESLTGLPTIRAFNEQERFINLNEHYIRKNMGPYYLLFVAQRWISVRLEFIGSFLVFMAALLGIFARGYLSPAYLGISLAYALQVTQMLNFCVRQFGETEVAMNAVERIDYYGKSIEREAAPESTPDHKPKSIIAKSAWPASGRIQVQNLKLRYSKDLPFVLKGISFSVADGEKIGIVGRTGSGKSTIMTALFRLVEPDPESVILLDDINGNTVNALNLGLDDLRRAFAIIPQDPVLFSGTVRSNLDPFNEYQDTEIWDAINRANLKEKISENSAGLDSAVQEGGENFSVGQRQLLCLARAMLKKPRILIMDEATANVDLETDSVIQKALREDFREATILTIAHRLNTIVDYDRVLVLSQGEIKEFDKPATLLADKSSLFSAMVEETGPANAELIRNLAMKNA